jgi:hypothetical protein
MVEGVNSGMRYLKYCNNDYYGLGSWERYVWVHLGKGGKRKIR